MSEAKHTLGPWRVEQPFADEYRILAHDQQIASLHEPEAHAADAMGEVEANADLIVRAVNSHADLLAVSREVLSFFAVNVNMTEHRDILVRLQAAIALAEPEVQP